VSLWREIAKKSLDELDEAEQSPEQKAKVASTRKRKMAAVVVGISVLGLLLLSGALTAIFKWVLGAAFIAGLIGGGWYLVRNRWYALKASMTEKRTQQIEEKAQVEQKQSLEDQLRELKRKKSETEKS
jgi:hypothetical protein